MSPGFKILPPTNAADRQWLYDDDELAHPPSCLGSDEPMSLARERYERSETVRMMWEIRSTITPNDGKPTPRTAMESAITFMHRFYMRERMQDFKPLVVAAACIFLAVKVEEHPRSLRTVVMATMHYQRNVERSLRPAGQPNPPPVNEKSQDYIHLRQMVLHAEEALLRTLCFDLTIISPTWAVIKGARMIWSRDEERANIISKIAWGVITDSFPTILSLRYPVNVIATAAIVCACAQLEIDLPAPPLDPATLKVERELAKEEGEEVEPAKEVELAKEVYWLELYNSPSVDDVKAVVKLMVDGYQEAQEPIVRKEAAWLATKALERCEQLVAAPLVSTSEPPPPTTTSTSEPKPVVSPSKLSATAPEFVPGQTLPASSAASGSTEPTTEDVAAPPPAPASAPAIVVDQTPETTLPKEDATQEQIEPVQVAAVRDEVVAAPSPPSTVEDSLMNGGMFALPPSNAQSVPGSEVRTPLESTVPAKRPLEDATEEGDQIKVEDAPATVAPKLRR